MYKGFSGQVHRLGHRFPGDGPGPGRPDRKALRHMAFGGFLTIGTITGGLYFTSLQQKKGLHNKTRHQGVFMPQTDLKPNHHAKTQKDSL